MLLTCLQVSADGGAMCLAKVMGHEHRNRLVHHFRNGVAENSFSGLVDEENGALFVDGDDGIRSRFGDDTEELGGLRELFIGRDRSGGFRFPWFRHSRLVACSLAQKALSTLTVQGASQPAAAVDATSVALQVGIGVQQEEKIAQLANN